MKERPAWRHARPGFMQYRMLNSEGDLCVSDVRRFRDDNDDGDMGKLVNRVYHIPNIKTMTMQNNSIDILY